MTSHTPQIAVTPSPTLPISVDRQQQIIDAINKKLQSKTRQGFCLMGQPGVGKTYLMKAIQNALIAAHKPGPSRRLITPHIFTLADWQTARVRQVRSDDAPLAEAVSAERVKTLARENERLSEAYGLKQVHPFVTYHVFIDEFDSQPTDSAFAQSGLQSLINALYENAPRVVPGNDQDFCQLVVAMNKTWPEFEAAYGTHVARRIAEMCVRIDFDRNSGVVEPKPENPNLMPDTLEEIFQ